MTDSVQTAMSEVERTPEQTPEAPKGDPWHAFGYLTGGVFFYGILGWLADRWLGTSFFVVIGILGGAALGIFQTWARFNRDDSSST